MKRTTFAATTVAILIATVSSASAMAAQGLIKHELTFKGYDSATINQLSATEVSQIEQALHNGEDSEINANVRNLMRKFTN